MPPQRWRRTRDPVGLGRNCTIFETARTWAYREVRHHFGDPQGLATAIHGQVQALNAQFAEPLPASEARAIATSIHRWITTKSRMWSDGAATYEATFTTIQAARSRKAATDRAEARDILVEAILAEQEQGERQAP